jgi:hypothetical protein
MQKLATLIAVAVAVVAAGFAAADSARANGDPASDVLLFGDVFVTPATSDLSAAEFLQLTKTVKEAKTSGFRIKVALIGEASDLGLESQLWQQPQPYADFLGKELASFGSYHRRLLVVMPNGAGIYSDRESTRGDKKVLAGLPPAGSRDALPATATKAVRSLAKSQGVALSLPPLEQPAGSNRGRYFRWLIVGVTFLVTAVVVYFGLSMFVARRRGRS